MNGWKREASGSISDKGVTVYSAPDNHWSVAIDTQMLEADGGFERLFSHVVKGIKLAKKP